MVGQSVRVWIAAMLALALLVLPRVALAQVFHDRNEFTVNMAMDNGPSCVTEPEGLRDPSACEQAVNVPAQGLTAAGSVLLGIAQRRVGSDVIVAVVTVAASPGHTKVGDRAIADFVTGMKGIMARDMPGAAEVSQTPMQLLSGAPHFSMMVESPIQGVPVQTRTHNFYAVDAIYSIAFVGVPRQQDAIEAWESAVLQSVRVRRAATYVPTYTDEPSSSQSFHLGESLGRLLGLGGLVVILIVVAMRARKKSTAQARAASATHDLTPGKRRRDWWE